MGVHYSSVGGVGFSVTKKEVEAIVGQVDNGIDHAFNELLTGTDFLYAAYGNDVYEDSETYLILIDDERYNDPELNVEALAEDVERLKAWASFNRLEKKVKFIHQLHIY